MKNLKFALLFAFILSIGLGVSSCTKEEIETETIRATLVLRPWTLTSDKLMAVEQLTEPCEKDDKWDFNSNGSFKISVNDACGNEKDSAGIWSLSTDDGKNILTIEGRKYEIEKCTATELILRQGSENIDLRVLTFK